MHTLRLKVLFALFLIITSILAYVFFWAPKSGVEWSRSNALIQTKNIPTFSNIDFAAVIDSLDQSIGYYSKFGEADQIFFGADSVSATHMTASLEKFREFLRSSPSSQEVRKFVEDDFLVYRSAAESVLFTGYYVPVLNGSRVRTERYQYPLYRTPDDLVSLDLSPVIKAKLGKDVPPISKGRLITAQNQNSKVQVPYLSREEIDGLDMLAGKGLEFVWVDSDVDRFFLHIQGSGKIRFEDGSTIRVGYADKNGHPYRAIGNTLIEKQLLSPLLVNMFTIRETLESNPTFVDEVLFSNPSYVFFRELSGEVLGSIGTALTPKISIATDSSLFPKGALAIYDTEFPVFNDAGALKGWEPHISFALNQDTGGAIRGPARVDVFFGDTPDADKLAGYMQHAGNLFFLKPR